jgi:hypothetical protein
MRAGIIIVVFESESDAALFQFFAGDDVKPGIQL